MIESYIEVSEGLKRKIPPEIIPLSKLPEWQEQHKFSTNGLFSSIFCYPTDDPYIGGVIGDFYLDFDCEENLDKAKKEAAAAVKKLKEYDIPEEANLCLFFGNERFQRNRRP